jgi:hypothetical protein
MLALGLTRFSFLSGFHIALLKVFCDGLQIIGLVQTFFKAAAVVPVA